MTDGPMRKPKSHPSRSDDMPEATTNDAAEEMRLIDQAVFKENVDVLDQGTGEASERVERLRHALRNLKVDPLSLTSHESLSNLKRGVRFVYELDVYNDDDRWCEHGFRHELSDGQYSWLSTITILLQRHNLPVNELPQETNAIWDVNKSLWSLSLQLEGVAELIDRICHKFGRSNENSPDSQLFTYYWAADILTNVQLETSLKTLWMVRYPQGNPKTHGHDFRKIWDELQDDHTNIIDHVAMSPIMFKCLALRETVENSVNWAFDTIPKDEWVESRYWFTSEWGKARVALPYHKFLISLAVYCVAAKAVIGRL